MTADIARLQPVVCSLPEYRRDEISLLNWFSLVAPSTADWQRWLTEVLGLMLQRPERRTVTLIRSSLIDTSARQERYSLDKPEFVLGREEDNDIVLAEATITKRHARLLWNGTVLRVEDLHSTLGTLANGRKLRPGDSRMLADGDQFVIFPYRFDVEIRREWIDAGPAALNAHQCSLLRWCDFRDALPAAFDAFTLNIEPVGQACLVFEAAFLRGLVERMLKLMDATSVFTAADEGLLELVLLAVLERANRDLAWPFHFSLGRRGAVPRLAAEERGYWCSAILSSGRLRGGVHVFLPRGLLESSRDAWTPPSTARQSTLADIKLGFPLAFGIVDLSSAEHRLIEPGDIIFYEPRPAMLWPGNDNAGWSLTPQTDCQFKVHSSLTEDVTMTENAQSEVVQFDQLPLRIHILFGEYEMTIREAESLAVGAVLDLDRDPAAPVKLACNGRVIGTGELVDIEGRIGVRVIEWNRR